MATPLNNHEKNIFYYKESYNGNAVIFGKNKLKAGTGEIFNNGFMGSNKIVKLTSNRNIVHLSPGCVAAPVIQMVARQNIILGVNYSQSKDEYLKIYAPIELVLSAMEVHVGQVNMKVEPDEVQIRCKLLKLYKFQEEEPESFELFRSYAGDRTEVEVVFEDPKANS